ncbi:hypothetical protein Javan173_0028 [Streptococcus phage Javan173]|uniref:hypothetical protein n=1 Tax=Streptococcus entericus TaxID=155680 RepID=UPI00037DDF09|nr:hypothetical protein [Streptococcus entericus]QBX15157.1 hypothetical protein Javan173_0028 [Streptococcus phage Javan173]
MNKWIKKAAIAAMTAVSVITLAACGDTEATTTARDEVRATRDLADKFADSQQTPTDIDYSLERYNLIRRAYWVNGQREKAIQLPSKIEKPMGYILLMNGSAVVGTFTVDGKVSSLNSFLTPDSEYYEYSGGDFSSKNAWLPDVDGSYGENDNGIFFFTPDGKYLEWTGEYLYSDIPFDVPNAIVNVN